MKIYAFNCFAFFAHYAPEELWRFAVDGQKQSSEGLKRWEEKEPGSIQSLLNAYAAVFNKVNSHAPLKVKDILEIHAISMQHKHGTLYANAQQPLTRQASDFIQPDKSWYYVQLILNNNLSLAGVAELADHLNNHGNSNTICCHNPHTGQDPIRPTAKPFQELFNFLEHPSIHVNNSSHKIYYWAANPPEKKYFYELIGNYLEFLQSDLSNHSLSDDEKLLALIRAVQYFSRLHPFPDGNTRTFTVVFLNTLLMQNDFLPAILSNPNQFDGYCEYELLEAVKAGMETTLSLMIKIKENPIEHKKAALWFIGSETAYLALRGAIQQYNPTPPQLPAQLPKKEAPYTWMIPFLKSAHVHWHNYILMHPSPPLAHRMVNALANNNILDFFEKDIRLMKRLLSHCAPHGIIILIKLCRERNWPITANDISGILNQTNPYKLHKVFNHARFNRFSQAFAYEFFTNLLPFPNPLHAFDAFLILLNHDHYNPTQIDILKKCGDSLIEMAYELITRDALQEKQDESSTAQPIESVSIDPIFSIDMYNEIPRLASHNLLTYDRYQSIVSHTNRKVLVNCLIILHSFKLTRTSPIEKILFEHPLIDTLWQALIQFERIMPVKPFTEEILTASLWTNIPSIAALLWEQWDDSNDTFLDLLLKLNMTLSQRTCLIDPDQTEAVIATLKSGHCLRDLYIPVIIRIFSHDTPIEIAKRAVQLKRFNRLSIPEDLDDSFALEMNDVRVENY